MFKKCSKLQSYQRGGWRPGSKHQKHMTLNPTLFLYRFPGPHGPGPYTMKYWWTLGCFPTGLDVPFRLNEFLATYQRHHIPLEVEEWLDCFLSDPLKELTNAIESLIELIEACATTESSKGYTFPEPSVVRLGQSLKKMGQCLGVRIPLLGIRAALRSPFLHEKILDDLSAYKEALYCGGSTFHRRLARSSFEEPTQTEGNVACDALEPLSTEVCNTVGSFVAVPAKSEDDELKLIRLFTTFAEGCASKKCYEDSFLLLLQTLAFAHDAESQLVVHTNVSKAALLDARFKEAEYHAREATLLLSDVPQALTESGAAYGLWATSVAYQDDFDRAENILTDALSIYPHNEKLQSLRQNIELLSAGRSKMNPLLRGKRYHLQAQQDRGILRGSGRGFDNEFDCIKFKNKLYPAKMNPSTNEMGSVFRRVGDLGGPISTSRSNEVL